MNEGVAAVDVTSRMAVFAHLFAEELGIDDVASVADAQSLVEIVKDRVPQSAAAPLPEAPVFEAAAFLGEWMRARAEALWVIEGQTEPHLQLTDPTHAIVILLPLVSLVRTAATAGYDGIAALLDEVLADVHHPAEEGELDSMRVVPEPDRERVLEWVRRNTPLADGARASLFRRCSVCSLTQEESVALPNAGASWESDAALAAMMLAKRAFRCPCGGAAGATTRFLMVTAEHGVPRLCDLYATPTHSRVASWLLATPTHLIPFDTTAFGEPVEAEG